MNRDSASPIPASARLAGAAPVMAVALGVTAGLWFAVYALVPPLAGMDAPLARLVFALKCSGVAILLTFMTGIEAIAHERLGSAAFDPLAGHETRRLRINARYAQNTAEQVLIFVPGLLMLALYSDGGAGMRAVVAATLVWTLSRFVFWIGYHRGAAQRMPGLVGYGQSLIILLYVCARFGYEVAGPVGASVPVLLFAAIEAIILLALRRTA